jgi:hypothetical protein
MKPGASITLDFNDSGNVRAKVLRGCVRMQKSGQGSGEMYTGEGSSEKTNSKRTAMGFCYLDGKLATYK